MRVSPHLFGQDHDFRNNPVIPIAHVIHRNRNEGWFNRLSILQQIKLVASAVYSAGFITYPVTERAIRSMMRFFKQGGVRTTVDKTYGLVDTFSKLNLRGSDTSEIAVNPKGDFETPVKRKVPNEPNMSAKQKRMRIENDEPMEEVAELRAVGANANTSWTTHGETPVDNIPVTRYTPFDKTTQVLMPFYVLKTNISLQPGNGAGSVEARSWRLNSIHDCETTTNYTEDPPRNPDTSDPVQNHPCMRNYWQEFYRKWTVVGSRYQIRFRSKNVTRSDSQYSIYVYEHGQQLIPVVDDNNNRIPDLFRKYHPHVKKHQYYNSRDQIDFTGGPAQEQRWNHRNQHNNWETIHKGTYNKNSIEHSVIEDEQQKTWHDFQTVPPEREAFTVIIQRSDASEINDVQLFFDLEVSIEYIVQLKDLKAKYEYFTQTTDLSAISNFGVQIF